MDELNLSDSKISFAPSEVILFVAILQINLYVVLVILLVILVLSLQQQDGVSIWG